MNDVNETEGRSGGEGEETGIAGSPSSAHASSPSDSPSLPLSVSDVSAVRELVLRAHPDTVPELVAGESVEALLASVEPARAAYRRVIESAPSPPAAPAAPTVPAGAAPPLAVDPDRLPPAEKIRRGLAARG